MTPAADLSTFIRHDAEGIAGMDFAIDGITCAACIEAIEAALRPLPGLTRARLNYTQRRLAVEWAESGFDPARIVEDLARLGYRATPFTPNDAEAAETRHARHLLRCLGVAGFAAMNVMLLSVAIWAGDVSGIDPATRDVFHWLSALIVLPAAAFAGQPFMVSAVRALRARRLNMDVPISLGILLALTMSVLETAHHARHAYYDSAIMLIFFLLIGRYLDQAMRRKTRAVAANLAALRAPTATRIETGTGALANVPAAALRPGDRVLVRPGERLPVDGLVLTGVSDIDAGLLTGETAPVRVTSGSPVYAGTLNLGGLLQVEVKTVAGTLLDDIERLIDHAVTARSRTLRLAERVSRVYAPVVHVTAAATAVGWLLAGASLHDALVTAIAVLIITCPCALALAVPAVQVVAAGRLFKAGVLLHAGDAIERLAEVDTIIFDKTGTLTLPDADVVMAGPEAPGLVAKAARLALASHHPLARALARRARAALPYADAHESPGEGVAATIDGVPARLGSPEFCDLASEAASARAEDPQASIIAFRRGEAHAIFLLRQRLRSDAAATIAALQGLGLGIEIASGDRSAPVAAAAAQTGIADWRAGLTPAAKIRRLDALKAQGRKTLMVGDGMNDAPALSAAHVSLSPITAADLAQASADALFLGERLAPVLEALRISRRARSLMRQNLGFALAYNLCAVPLAIAGEVTPLIAAAAMSGSSILVTLNALRAARAVAPRAPSKAMSAAHPAEAATRPAEAATRPAEAATRPAEAATRPAEAAT